MPDPHPSPFDPLADKRRDGESNGAASALPGLDLAQALQVARTTYGQLIDAVADSITVLARDGRILEVNQTACRTYGWTREQMLQMSVFDLSPAIPHSRIDDVLIEHADGEPFTQQAINRRADGSLFPVEVHSRVFVLDNQPRIVAVARDITSRLAAEAGLRDSEARYRQLLQAMDKGVLVQDAFGCVLSVNPAACRILGRSEDDLVGQPICGSDWRFVDEHGHALPDQQLPSARAIAERRTIESTTVGMVFDGGARQVWLAVTATPQIDLSSGAPFQVISTFDDVTALKRDSDLFLRTQRLARIGGWDLQPGSGEMYWSEALFHLLDRLPAATVELSTLLDHIGGTDRDRVAFAFEDACRNGSAIDIECRVTSARGRSHWARISGEARSRDSVVYRVTGTLQDITREKQQQELLRRQAASDPLTGLANRDAFIERTSMALDQAQQGNGPVVLHVDLDRFKVVNDLLGHEAGDALVRAAGKRLAATVDDAGFVARMGGDEFLVLLGIGGKLEGSRLAERINAAFASPFLHDDEEFALTASVGVAYFPDDGSTAQQLLQSADAAMLEAKRRGRNAWQAFNPALARQISDRLLIETQLRRALKHGELHLVYQPQVELASGRMRSVEALLRWNNRLLGPMSPSVFIPHAETTGDIVRIGAWVIREACRQLRDWRQGGLELQRVAVNVSFRQFLNEEFEQQVLGALAEFGLPGDSLELEITERAFLEDEKDTVAILRGLRAHGVMVSIDDFGEGYSALNYLRRLPIDALKISNDFMREIPSNQADAVICRSIIQIARSLGLTVIGEGVEERAQRQFLLDHGADLAQGYLFAKPMLPEDVPSYRPPGAPPAGY